MSEMTSFILANFTVPSEIGVNSQSMLWLLPLVAAISIVYKSTKIPVIKFTGFVKEVAVLFGSIVIFMIVTAMILYVVPWLLHV